MADEVRRERMVELFGYDSELAGKGKQGKVDFNNYQLQDFDLACEAFSDSEVQSGINPLPLPQNFVHFICCCSNLRSLEVTGLSVQMSQ
jgi:hypothetical protein